MTAANTGQMNFMTVKKSRAKSLHGGGGLDRSERVPKTGPGEVLVFGLG